MKKAFVLSLVLLITGGIASCASPPPSPSVTGIEPSATLAPTGVHTMAPVSVKLGIVQAYPALTFEKPLYFIVAGDGTQDCFVVEQSGRIRIFTDRSDAANSAVFLDIRDRIDSTAGEKGLLGLAFDPGYKNNGILYVNYTNQKNTVISRFTRRKDNPREADPASEQVLLTFAQPYDNHNGGQLAFGPDGLLYIATGDGGSGGDPQNNAQNLTSLLGKILRIDVNHPASGKAYGIPADNPYAGNSKGYKEEIYALGLRNPWRFSFDAQGTLWAGDVGQGSREEIDLIQKGRNYGWSAMEGTIEYKSIPGVDKNALMPPVFEYKRDQGTCITGGYVYDSDRIPDLKGRYIYGDYVSGRIWALWIDQDKKVHNSELLDTGLNISSFGIDAQGDIRIVDLAGKVYRLQVSGT